MLGREAELAALGHVLESGRAAVVTGEAGIGKTTLARAALERVDRPRHETGCLQTLSWMSFLPFRRVLGGPPRVGDAVAVADEVGQHVGRGILLLDDLQWADADTLDALSSLLETVSVVVTVRSGEPGTKRALGLLVEHDAEVHELGPLAPEAAAALVRDLDAGLSPADVDAVVTRGAGNPLFLEELVAGGGVTPDLRRSVGARLRALDPEVQHAVVRAALLGRPGPAALLGPGADAALRAGVLVQRGPDCAVRHPLFAEVAAEVLVDEEGRRRIHGELAACVIEVGERARHHLAAGETEPALQLALEAAAGAVHAGERARDLAVAARAASGPDYDRLRLDAAAALFEAGDAVDGLAMLDLVEGRDPETRAEVAWARGRTQQWLGDAAGAAALFDEGLALVDGTASPAEVRLRVHQVFTAVKRWDPECLALAERAWTLAAETGIEPARARSNLGLAHLVVGSPDWRDHLEAAVSLARETGEREVEFTVTADLAVGLFLSGEWRASEQIGREGAERAAAARLLGQEFQYRCGLGFLRVLCRAEYDGVIAELGRLLTRPLGENHYYLLSALVISHALRGRHDAAAELLRSGDARRDTQARNRSHHEYARCESAWLAGRLTEAKEAADACVAVGGLFPMLNEAAVIGAWSSFELGLDPGDPPDPPMAALVAPTTVEFEGVAALGRGDHAVAIERFAEAAAGWTELIPYTAHRARWGHGEALRRSGQPDAARSVLTAVEADADAVGHVPLVNRIRRSLRVLGDSAAAPSPPQDGAITARQREILALVGEGLSSAEIGRRLGLSARSVDSAIDLACERLGASTRIQAAVLAREV